MSDEAGEPAGVAGVVGCRMDYGCLAVAFKAAKVC